MEKEVLSEKEPVASTKTQKRNIKNIPTMAFEDVIVLAEAIWECASGKKVRKILCLIIWESRQIAVQVGP